MQFQVVLLFLAFIAAVCAGIRLEEPVISRDPEPDEVGLQAEQTPTTQGDTGPLLVELDPHTSDQIPATEQAIPFSRSPKKCCKLGRQAAQKGLYCAVDMMQVHKRPNVVHRRKMKFHGSEVQGKTSYKDLMRRVEKCAISKASESMFIKCCEWQEAIISDLEQCKRLATLAERRLCRRTVQSRE